MILALKLLLAPLLVVASSWAGRRWGAGVAGTLVGFPIVAGPVLLIMALDHGTRFGARAASASVLVLAITGISAVAGPVISGILAPFPVATSVIAAFVLMRQGPAAAVRAMRGVTRGLVGFATFCFLVAVLLVPYGVVVAFAVAVAGVLVAQLSATTWTAWRRHRHRVSGAGGGRARRGG